MANSTLLSLFQTTLQGMGVAAYGNPATVIGNTNQDVVQTLALVNAAGDELNREYQWQASTIVYRFTTVYYTYTGTLTASSTSITSLSSTTGITTSPTLFQVVGTGVNSDTELVSVDSGTSSAVMTQAAASSGTGVSLSFAQIKYTLPTDWDRAIDRTDWDKTKHWEMVGPATAQQWELLKSGYISTGPRIQYRILGNYFQIWPAQVVNDYLGFEYSSKYWIYATGGTAVSKQAFSVDTDTCIFPDALMRALIKLKYYEAKGFDTTALYRAYTTQLDIAKANDAGSPTLSFAPRPGTVLITANNIPDSGYGQ